MLRIIVLALTNVVTTIASPITNTSLNIIQGVPKDLSWCEQLVYTPDTISIGKTAPLCSCFDSGNSATRLDLISAIQSFCLLNSPFVSHFPDVANPIQGMYSYDSTTSDPLGGRRTLAIRWEWWTENVPKTQDTNMCKTTEGVQVTFDQCLEGFLGVVDGCDTEGEIEKQGGAARDACLLWIVDLSPDEE